MKNKKICVVFDLDDTLLPEWRFVASGSEVALKWLQNELTSKRLSDSERIRLHKLMVKSVLERRNHYNVVEDWLGSQEICSQELMPGFVEILRNHTPIYKMPKSTRALLQELKAQGIILGIITDGRTRTQNSKLISIGINRYIDKDLIFISESEGYDKLSPHSFKAIEKMVCADAYVYVGDNVSKDFIIPKRLGWLCVMLSHQNYFIHNKVEEPEEYQRPDAVIGRLSELPELIKSIN